MLLRVPEFLWIKPCKNADGAAKEYRTVADLPIILITGRKGRPAYPVNSVRHAGQTIVVDDECPACFSWCRGSRLYVLGTTCPPASFAA